MVNRAKNALYTIGRVVRSYWSRLSTRSADNGISPGPAAKACHTCWVESRSFASVGPSVKAVCLPFVIKRVASIELSHSSLGQRIGSVASSASQILERILSTCQYLCAVRWQAEEPLESFTQQSLRGLDGILGFHWRILGGSWRSILGHFRRSSGQVLAILFVDIPFS